MKNLSMNITTLKSGQVDKNKKNPKTKKEEQDHKSANLMAVFVVLFLLTIYMFIGIILTSA